MRKFNFRYYALSLIIIALGFLGVFSFRTNNNLVLAEENIPEYFSVIQYSTYEGDSSENNRAYATINNGDVAYVRYGHVVEALLRIDDPTDQRVIKHINPYITFNSRSYTNSELFDLGIQVSYVDNAFSIITRTDDADYFPYGRYDLTINYIINENGVDNNKSFSFTYYVLQEQNYFSSSKYGSCVQSTFNFTFDEVYRAAASYDRVYSYQYQKTENSQKTNQLPTLTFNKKNFRLCITKTFQKNNTIQNIWFDGTTVQTDNNLVYFEEDDATDNVIIYFNDLGLYSISYTFTYVYDGNIDVLNQSNNMSDMAISTQRINKCDALEIFGYQAYYSDVFSGELKEFKTLEDGVIGNEITDITYQTADEFKKAIYGEVTNSITSTTTTVDTEADTLALLLGEGGLLGTTIKVQSTNQAPVQFKYNVEIFNKDNNEDVVQTQSKYWKLAKSGSTYSIVPNSESQQYYDYDNSPFTQTGIYLVKLVYKNHTLVNGSNVEDNWQPSEISGDRSIQLSAQWFVFQITKDTSEFEIKNESNQALLDQSFTNQSVTVRKSSLSSIFNAKTRVDIYVRANYTGAETFYATVGDGEVVGLQNNGKYRVTMYFGKNYTRNYSTNFSIDKTPIEGIQISSLAKLDAEYYVKEGTVDFLTNQPVMVMWNEKSSGSKTTAEYKYIPLTKDNSTNYSNAMLENLYSYGAVPVQYMFDYRDIDGGLQSVEYANNIASDYIRSSNALTQAGMYIFRIYDTAGNKQYFAFIIDNTQNKILQKINGEFTEIEGLNILSSDVTVIWGTHKVIKFNNLKISSRVIDVKDTWLSKILNETDVYTNYFEMLSINTVNTFFTKTPINELVYCSIGDGTYFAIEGQDQYEIEFLKDDGNGGYVANELQYVFYTRDNANTKYADENNKTSFKNYEQYYSGTHSVIMSSDASRTVLTYTTSNNQEKALVQDSFMQTDTTQSTQSKYYIPTTANLLASCNEIINLTFNPKPEEGVLEIENITYTYSPFSKTSYSDTIFGYKFEQPGSPITIYSRLSPEENLATPNGDGTYNWEVNKEYVYSPITSLYQTMAGKYTITRVYSNLTSTSERINANYDYMTRTFTFIVDRYGIITAPEVVDEDGTMFNYIGEAIKLQVLEDGNSGRMVFNDIYIASNLQGNDEAILVTNKLPVFVFIPEVKYGYSYEDDPQFRQEKTIVNWNASDASSKINSYALSAEIVYAAEKSQLALSKEKYTSQGTANGYLKFNNTNSGIAFKKVGYYKVTINQGYTAYLPNTFSFVFQIYQSEPAFTITNVNDEEFNSANGVYYTNKDVVRLSWVDSENLFEAKIDKEQIYYKINNLNQVKVDSNQITTVGNRHFVDINLKNIGAYANNSRITFSMQYEGDEMDYNEGYFRTSHSLVIDTVAPAANIRRLVELNNIDYDLVRTYGSGYNTSVNTGLYRYFAFAIDKQNISSILDLNSHSDGEAYNILYRYFETTTNGVKVYTKYNDIFVQETSPSSIENSTDGFEVLNARSLASILETLNQHTKPYLEIVERDMAGNITVYTIYITDYEAMAQTNVFPITYNISENPKNVLYADVSARFNVYAKSSFSISKYDMFGYDWSILTVGATKYLKTPYSEGYYINLNTYNPANVTESQFELEQITRLLPSAQKQVLTFGFVPYFGNIVFDCSVLNSSLDVKHTSTISAYANEEGLLIKVPTNSTNNAALIYANYVEIVHFVKTQNMTSYIQENLYKKEDATYFSSADQILENTSIISSVYVNYMGSVYLKITINEPQKNRYYKYLVKDNFMDEYSLTNIYGSEPIEKELYSSVDIVENYENGVRYYYSTKDITYVYNYKKDTITIVSSATPRVFKIEPNTNEYREFNALGYGRIDFSTTTDLCVVVLYAAKQDMANGIIGGERSFVIRVYEAIEEINNGLPYKTLNLVTYNYIPSITLLDIYNNSQNALFNKDTMYGNDLKITFKQNVGRIPCAVILEYEDGTKEQIVSGKVLTSPGLYSLIIKYTELFTADQYNTYLEFIISDNDEDFYQVRYLSNNSTYKYATPTGNNYTFVESNTTYTITTHYILNTSEFEIVCNTDQDVKVQDSTIIRNGDYSTYIYIVSNNDSTNASKYFKKTIAITVIPRSTNILTKYSYYTNEGTRTIFDTTKTQESFVVSTEENNTSYKRIAWQSYYGIPENKVTATIYFGDNQQIYNAETKTEGDITIVTLKSSGTYYLSFKDMAGNTHMFNQLLSTYTIKYLRSVIYNVNGESPINNAVYDDTVTVSIPASTLSYYDRNAQPSLTVLKNGNEYTPEYSRETRSYIFTEAGLYKIWFSAAVTENGVVKNINEQPLYFLIIKPNESRSAFELGEYADYYIESVVRENVDITDRITNENMGKLVEKTLQDDDGVYYKKLFLKNLFISVNDAVTGSGNYTITVNTANEFGQKFTFSFWINNKPAPINVSIEDNSSTTNPIIVSFNTSDLLEDVGDCVLKITGLNDYHLSKQAFADGELKSSYSFSIDKSGTYFIQLYTESGKLLYSYKVTKNEPLNAISIILIVASSIIAVVGVIVFIKLRKRMKVR